MKARHTVGRGPGPQCFPPLPTAGVQKDHVTRLHGHTLDGFQCHQILIVDGGARFQPAFRRGLARQQGGIEQHGTGEDAILVGHDAAARATVGGFHFLPAHAVVAHALEHDVTVQGVQVAVNGAVIAAAVLVAIRGAGRGHPQHFAVQHRRGVHGRFLIDVMGQGYGDAFGHQGCRQAALFRCDVIGRPQFIILAPAAPVGQLGHGPPEIRLGFHGGMKLCQGGL